MRAEQITSARENLINTCVLPGSACGALLNGKANQVCVGTKAGDIRIFDLRTAKYTQTMKSISGGHEAPITQLLGFGRSGHFMSLDYGGIVKFWTGSNMECFHNAQLPHAQPNFLQRRPVVTHSQVIGCSGHFATSGIDGKLLLHKLTLPN